MRKKVIVAAVGAELVTTRLVFGHLRRYFCGKDGQPAADETNKFANVSPSSSSSPPSRRRRTNDGFYSRCVFCVATCGAIRKICERGGGQPRR